MKRTLTLILLVAGCAARERPAPVDEEAAHVARVREEIAAKMEAGAKDLEESNARRAEERQTAAQEEARAQATRNSRREACLAVLPKATRFRLRGSASNDAWGRAEVFVAKFSTAAIKRRSENVIETFSPPESSTREIGFLITRTPVDDESEFEIHPAGRGILGIISGDEIAQAAAHFMRTGEVIEDCVR